jgi:hypothetical protein
VIGAAIEVHRPLGPGILDRDVQLSIDATFAVEMLGFPIAPMAYPRVLDGRVPILGRAFASMRLAPRRTRLQILSAKLLDGAPRQHRIPSVRPSACENKRMSMS